MSEQQKTNEAAQTLDGWYALHDFRTMDWSAWKMLSSDERQIIISEFTGLLEKWESLPKRRKRKPYALQHRRPESGLHADDFAPYDGGIKSNRTRVQ